MNHSPIESLRFAIMGRPVAERTSYDCKLDVYMTASSPCHLHVYVICENLSIILFAQEA